MKFNINWKELGKQLWKAVKPVLLGALGGGIVAVTGCSSMQPSDKTQSISLYALGIPGVAVVTSTQQTAENFRPAAEEAAVRDEEAAQFSRFGGNGPGFMSV